MHILFFIKIFIVLIILQSCSQAEKNLPVGKKDSAVYYPYSPVNSNEFENGKKELAKNVLQVWRQYENGNVLNEKNNFADSIRLILPDIVFTGKRDSILTLLKKRRDSYNDMQCFVYSWMPVHIKNTNEDEVYVWGLQDGSKTNRERDYSMVHEVWRFNENGKIKEMEQYRTHPH